MTQTAVSNYQYSLALTQAVLTAGVFPSPGRAGASEGDFLGQIVTFAFGSNILPGGMLAADGQTLSFSEYTALLSVEGTYFGGNGTSNFDLPNLSGDTMIGVGTGPGLFPVSIGEQTGVTSTTLTVANLPTSYGGKATTIDNEQPSLGVTYMIAVNGVYPSQGGDTASNDMVGEVVAFTGNYAALGFMACDGQLLSISQYNVLFNILGTTYGGNGITTFALPDLQGRTIIGASASDPLGDEIGSANVAIPHLVGNSTMSSRRSR